MNLNRVCAGSVLALYCVAHARINTLSTLHLVRGVALQSIVNSLYFDAVLICTCLHLCEVESVKGWSGD